MRKLAVLTTLFLALAIICLGQNSEKLLVKEAFSNYKKAILNDKGDDAVRYVDDRTIKYYNNILAQVKSADSLTVMSLSLMDKLMVFAIRHRTSKEDILSFDGKKLLVYAIKNGMVGKGSVTNVSIGEITVDKNFAKGQLIANGQKAPFYFNFYKEEHQWKVNLTSLFPLSTIAFKKMADESGQPENEYLFHYWKC